MVLEGISSDSSSDEDILATFQKLYEDDDEEEKPPKRKPATANLPKSLDQVVTKKRGRFSNKALNDTYYKTANELEQRDILKSAHTFQKPKVEASEFDVEPFPQPVERTEVPYVEETKAWPITDLRDHELSRHDEEAALFFRHLDRNNEIATNVVGVIPERTETLAYVAQLENRNRALWFEASQNLVITQGKGKWPEIPQVTRSYVLKFAREPDPAVQWERPCSHKYCECLRLFGWRGVEFHLPQAMLQIVSAVQKNQPVPLSPVVGWCVLCHYATTNQLYIQELNRIQEKRNKGLPVDPADTLYCIHHFSFPVDRVGEYRLSQCLVGDTEAMGLYGCFPVYNCHHYVETKVVVNPRSNSSREPRALRTWKESEHMVFRPVQTLPTITSSTTTRGDTEIHASSRFGPTMLQ